MTKQELDAVLFSVGDGNINAFFQVGGEESLIFQGKSVPVVCWEKHLLNPSYLIRISGVSIKVLGLSPINFLSPTQFSCYLHGSLTGERLEMFQEKEFDKIGSSLDGDNYCPNISLAKNFHPFRVRIAAVLSSPPYLRSLRDWAECHTRSSTSDSDLSRVPVRTKEVVRDSSRRTSFIPRNES